MTLPSNPLKNTVKLVAPSGIMPDPARIPTCLQHLQNMGLNVFSAPTLYRQNKRFAGSLNERLSDFQLDDSVPNLLMAARGGYGAMQLLPHLNYDDLGEKCHAQQTLIMGYSDFTAIQLALFTKARLPYFAGPMAYSDFSQTLPNAYTVNAFQTVCQQNYTSLSAISNHSHPSQTLEGTVWGGNLSVLVALIGTPYFPDIQGGILFLEEVGEQPYRVERLLQQLALSGVLQNQQAVIFGDNLCQQVDAYDPSYDFDHVIDMIQSSYSVPFLKGLPFGHGPQKTTLPLGVEARLFIEPQSWRLEIPEHWALPHPLT